MPGLIGSLLLMILGAVAKYAYSDSVWAWGSGDDSHSVQVETVGTILLIAGAIALVLSMAYAFTARRDYDDEVFVYEDTQQLPKTRTRKTAVDREVDVDAPIRKPRRRRE